MEELNFEFAKYTEVTDWAFEVNPQYKEGKYTRIFICPDVTDYQLIRVLPGFGVGYNKNPDAIMVEHNMIPKQRGIKHHKNNIKRILKDDDFSNWDCHVFSSMDSVIDSIDGGFGILNLKDNGNDIVV